MFDEIGREKSAETKTRPKPPISLIHVVFPTIFFLFHVLFHCFLINWGIIFSYVISLFVFPCFISVLVHRYHMDTYGGRQG